MPTVTRLAQQKNQPGVHVSTLMVPWENRLGYWSALLVTLIGIVYFCVILGLLITGNFVFPPSNSVQLFGGIVTLVSAQVLVVLMVCVHNTAPTDRKIFSQTSLMFTVLFAGMVTINRFVQLSVVRTSILTGDTTGLERFLPYGDHSVMFALEMLGWGFFLGLAALFAAPVFSKGKMEQWLRWLFVTYGILGLVSGIGYLMNSPISVIGFVAWGFILYLATGLLAFRFKRASKAPLD